MASINQPTNKNFLSQLGFNFTIKRLPNVSFFVTECNLPGVTATPAVIATPFKQLHFSADKLEYSEFLLSFKVDEDLTNYKEIYRWIVGLTFPEKFEQRGKLVATDGIFSDATLTILNSAMNPNITVTFQDLLPVSLSDISMSAGGSDVEYITATASFRYKLYKIDGE